MSISQNRKCRNNHCFSALETNSPHKNVRNSLPENKRRPKYSYLEWQYRESRAMRAQVRGRKDDNQVLNIGTQSVLDLC